MDERPGRMWPRPLPAGLRPDEGGWCEGWQHLWQLIQPRRWSGVRRPAWPGRWRRDPMTV